MKRCPQCSKYYSDETLNFCLDDGTRLSPEYEPDVTIPFSSSVKMPRSYDKAAINESVATVVGLPLEQKSAARIVNPHLIYAITGLVALFAIIGAFVWFNTRTNGRLTEGNDNQTRTSSLPSPNAVALNSERRNGGSNTTTLSTIPPAQVDSRYRATGVRAGTSDGKRLRIVVDFIANPNSNSNPVRADTVNASSGMNETRIAIDAALASDNIRYESKAARQLGVIQLAASSQGVQLTVEPKRPLFYKETFFIQASRLSPNDRLVIDLCVTQSCPSLKPER